MASRRAYLTIPELEEFAAITVTDETEAYDQISQAEELIDAYVGFQEKAVPCEYHGEVTAVSANTIFDTESQSPLNVSYNDAFKGCEVEIIGGTGAGQRRTISSSSKDGKSITISEAFTTAPDTTSHYRIYQLGKFPRKKDRHTNRSGDQYFYSIPEAVRRATAAQVAYIIEKGPEYFSGDDSQKTAESIGNYSYQTGGGSSGGQSSVVRLVGPRAQALLRGITNRLGQMVG
jgi:hypothetical protein